MGASQRLPKDAVLPEVATALPREPLPQPVLLEHRKMDKLGIWIRALPLGVRYVLHSSVSAVVSSGKTKTMSEQYKVGKGSTCCLLALPLDAVWT